MSNSINSSESPRLKGLNRFFCWCSGAELNILEKYPTDWIRFYGIGIIIFLTGVFATISSAYALSSVFQDSHSNVNYLLVAPASLIWGIFIFFLDRFFIAGMHNSDTKLQRFLIALPRLIIALFLGIVISRPLELRIFQPEIMRYLSDSKPKIIAEKMAFFHQEEIKIYKADSIAKLSLSKWQKINALKSTQNQINQKIDTLSKAVKIASDNVNCECNGVCGTNKKGRGPACKFNELVYARALAAYNKEITAKQPELASISSSILSLSMIPDSSEMKLELEKGSKLTALNLQKKQWEDDFNKNYKGSLLDQSSTLSKMSEGKDNLGVLGMVIFISTLFIFIEMAPVISKMFTKKGSYEDAFEKQERQQLLDLRKNAFILREEYKTNKGLISKMAKSQRVVIKKSIDDWQTNEMSKPRNSRDTNGINYDDEL